MSTRFSINHKMGFPLTSYTHHMGCSILHAAWTESRTTTPLNQFVSNPQQTHRCLGQCWCTHRGDMPSPLLVPPPKTLAMFGHVCCLLKAQGNTRSCNINATFWGMRAMVSARMRTNNEGRPMQATSTALHCTAQHKHLHQTYAFPHVSGPCHRQWLATPSLSVACICPNPFLSKALSEPCGLASHAKLISFSYLLFFSLSLKPKHWVGCS